MLVSFHECSFRLPLHPFVRGLLFFYGLEVQNLHPNSVLHIVCFITLCEAYLGMEPHWKMWRHMFSPWLSTARSGKSHVGNFTIQLRSSRQLSYLKIPFCHSFAIMSTSGSMSRILGERAIVHWSSAGVQRRVELRRRGQVQAKD